MTEEQIALWVQVAAVLAAVAASIIALAISASDRKTSRQIAADDRRASLTQTKLTFEMDALLRLSRNLARGGTTDDQQRRDMGAEAMALVGAIGPERLPKNYAKTVEKTDAELVEFVDDTENPGFLRYSVESLLALKAVTAELNALIEEQARKAKTGK